MVIGIAVRTSNADGAGIRDIGNLWKRFMEENILAAIPDKADNTVYSVYTDYEGDYTQPYTTILGCRVNSLDEIPEGMVGKSIQGGDYVLFSAKGDLSQGVVGDKWMEIWQSDLKRSYRADFEVYGEKAANALDAEVDIWIGVL